MSSFQIENHSSDTAYVAVAYNHYSGHLIAEGWWPVPPNQSQTFTAADLSDMHLRVQSTTGDDITFNNFNSFLWWIIPQDRFTLGKIVQTMAPGSGLALGKQSRKHFIKSSGAAIPQWVVKPAISSKWGWAFMLRKSNHLSPVLSKPEIHAASKSSHRLASRLMSFGSGTPNWDA